MGYALGHLKFVSCITHRPLHSAGLATRVTPVRGREIYKMGHAPGVCDRCQDLITDAMSPKGAGRGRVVSGLASPTMGAVAHPPSV